MSIEFNPLMNLDYLNFDSKFINSLQPMYEQILEAPSDVQSLFNQFEECRREWNNHYTHLDPQNKSNSAIKVSYYALRKIYIDLKRTENALLSLVYKYFDESSPDEEPSSFSYLLRNIKNFIKDISFDCSMSIEQTGNRVKKTLFQSWDIENCPKSMAIIQNSIVKRPITQSIPSDLLIEIASYFTPKEVAAIMVPVSRAWTKSCCSEKMIKLMHQIFNKNLDSIPLYKTFNYKFPFSLKQIYENQEGFRNDLISNLHVIKKASLCPFFRDDIHLVDHVMNLFKGNQHKTIEQLLQQDRFEEAFKLNEFRNDRKDLIGYGLYLYMREKCFSGFLSKKKQNPDRALELALKCKDSRDCYKIIDKKSITFEEGRAPESMILQIAEYYFINDNNLKKGLEILDWYLDDEEMRAIALKDYKVLYKIIQSTYKSEEFEGYSLKELIEEFRNTVLLKRYASVLMDILPEYYCKLLNEEDESPSSEFSDESKEDDLEEIERSLA